MQVIAAELGHRPVLLTKARRFAPEGVRVLTDLLSRYEFADAASIVLDWDNVLLMQPPEVAKPFVLVRTHNFVEGRRLDMEIRLDVEDLFGNDAAIAEDFIEIIHSLERKVNETLVAAGYKERRSGH